MKLVVSRPAPLLDCQLRQPSGYASVTALLGEQPEELPV